MIARRTGPLIAVLLLAPFVLSPTTATAGKMKRQQRVVEETYHSPAVVAEAADGGAYACSPNPANGQAHVGCVDVPSKPTEGYLSVEAIDSSGLPAPFWVVQESTNTGGPVCGKTDEPMRIAPGVEVTIWIYPYMADPLCRGISTTGTLRLTFSNVP